MKHRSIRNQLPRCIPSFLVVQKYFFSHLTKSKLSLWCEKQADEESHLPFTVTCNKFRGTANAGFRLLMHVGLVMHSKSICSRKENKMIDQSEDRM
jgi:hypothetical protein